MDVSKHNGFLSLAEEESHLSLLTISVLAFIRTSCRVSDWDTIRLMGKSPFTVKYGEKTTEGFLFPCLKGEAQLLQSGTPSLSNIPLLILKFVSCAS